MQGSAQVVAAPESFSFDQCDYRHNFKDLDGPKQRLVRVNHDFVLKANVCWHQGAEREIGATQKN